MSTSNFYCGNVRSIYAFGSNVYYTEDVVKDCDLDESLIGEYDEFGTQDNFEYSRDFCKDLLKQKGWFETDGWEGSNRGYELHYTMAKDEYACVHGVEYRIRIKAGHRIGYYEGANFDYDFEIEEYCSGLYNGVYDYIPSLREVITAFECRDGRPRRRTAETEYLQGKLLKLELDKVMDDLFDEVEEAFKEACEVELGVSARFGNGETWYSAIG